MTEPRRAPLDVLNEAAYADFEHVVVVGIDRDGIPHPMMSTSNAFGEAILHAAWRLMRDMQQGQIRSEATH